MQRERDLLHAVGELRRLDGTAGEEAGHQAVLERSGDGRRDAQARGLGGGLPLGLAVDSQQRGVLAG
jgi:hypothetical protein